MHTEGRTRTHCWFQVRMVDAGDRLFLVGLREDGKRFGVKLDPAGFDVTKTAAQWFDIALLSLDHFLVWENDDTETDTGGSGFTLDDEATLFANDPWREQDVEWYLARSPFKQKVGVSSSQLAE